MNKLINACVLSALLTLSAPAMADQPAAAPAAEKPGSGAMMMCPMMGNMSQMQKDMASMKADLDTIQKDTTDSAAKDRMQKLGERMDAMMSGMQKMGGMGMMGQGMMGAGNSAQVPAVSPTSAPATVSPEDHKAHHPEGGK